MPERKDTTAETFRCDFLPRIATALGSLRRLVLLLDEFDVIDESRAGPEVATGQFVPYLAGLLAAAPEIGVVMVVGRRTEELSDAFHTALLKDSVQMRIGRLTENQVDQMLRQLSEPTLTFDPTAVARVYFMAAGHPYCTQAICNAVWSRAAGRRPRVEAADVDRVIDAAVQLGTNGMSWIFDGLELPEQRIFVSALSEATDPISGPPLSLGGVQSFLRNRHLSVSQSDLGGAARDLQLWDVLQADDSGAFQFAVPLLGQWIRRERPLMQLEREIRFVSPRAWYFYEAAREAERSGKLDDAIAEYHDALAANPVFLEAQRALASALHKRGTRRDRRDAIEAWERVLELDPESPKTDLLDTLLSDLESAGDIETIRARFSRIKQLDLDGTNFAHLDGMIHARARREVEQRATAQLATGSKDAVRRAIAFYDLLEDNTQLRRAREILARQEKLNNICVGGSLALLAASAAWGFISFLPAFQEVRLLIFGASGTLFSWAIVYEKEFKITFFNSGALFFVAAVGVGEWIIHAGGPFFAAGFVAWFGSILNMLVSPTIASDGPRSDTGDDGGEAGSTGLVQLLDLIINRLTQLSVWLRQHSNERKRSP